MSELFELHRRAGDHPWSPANPATAGDAQGRSPLRGRPGPFLDLPCDAPFSFRSLRTSNSRAVHPKSVLSS
ncbi:MAG: hypothetical protein GY856_38125 [bacterium]|nr:hypothetical protein [bacterium]